MNARREGEKGQGPMTATKRWLSMTRPAVAAVLAVIMVLAACGGDDDAGADAPSADTTSADTTSADTAAPDTTAPDTTAVDTTAGSGYVAPGDSDPSDTTGAPSDGEAIMVATTDLGDIVVDAAGLTLYLFTPDEQGASTCTDECAFSWPPLVGEFGAGDGLDASLMGAVERDDGTMQVTYGGWPLYYYGGDGGPGDVNGQGVNGVWYVVSPAGEAIGAP